MRTIRHLPMDALLSGAALCIAFAANAAEPSPSDRLKAWEGNWVYKSEYKKTQFSQARTNTGTGKCAWLPDHGFMVCDFLGDSADRADGVPDDDLSIFYYSSADRAYKYTRMAHDGAPQEGTTTVDGNMWTVTMEVPRRSGGTAELRDIYEFVSPDKRVMKTAVSIDKGAHWTEIGRTVSTKVAS